MKIPELKSRKLAIFYFAMKYYREKRKKVNINKLEKYMVNKGNKKDKLDSIFKMALESLAPKIPEYKTISKYLREWTANGFFDSSRDPETKRTDVFLYQPNRNAEELFDRIKKIFQDDEKPNDLNQEKVRNSLQEIGLYKVIAELQGKIHQEQTLEIIERIDDIKKKFEKSIITLSDEIQSHNEEKSIDIDICVPLSTEELLPLYELVMTTMQNGRKLKVSIRGEEQDEYEWYLKGFIPGVISLINKFPPLNEEVTLILI